MIPIVVPCEGCGEDVDVTFAPSVTHARCVRCVDTLRSFKAPPPLPHVAPEAIEVQELDEHGAVIGVTWAW